MQNYMTPCMGLHTVQRETFEGENFRKFRGFVAIHESFLCDIWDVAFFGAAKASNPRNIFSTKIVFFTNSRKFSPSKVSCYIRTTCSMFQRGIH